MTPNHHSDYDGDNEGGREIENACERWDGSDRRKVAASWDWTPQSVTAMLGMIGLIGAGIWGFADFRVTLADINTRITAHSERMSAMDKRITEIDTIGPRPFAATDLVIKNLQNQVDDLKEITKDLNSTLNQHNEMTLDLYKKDISDGKRDFKIPPNAPKYHR